MGSGRRFEGLYAADSVFIAVVCMFGSGMLWQGAGLGAQEAVTAQAQASATAGTFPPSAPFVSDEHTLLLLHADRGGEGRDASPVGMNVGAYVGNIELCKGRFGQAFNLTDWRSRIEIPAVDRFDFTGASGITIEFWMRMHELPRFMNASLILRKKGMFHIWASRNRSKEVLGAFLYDAKGGKHWVEMKFPVPDLDFRRWHHYAFVWQAQHGKTPGFRCLFVDGKLRGRMRGYGFSLGRTNDVMLIGNSLESRSYRGTRPFNGALDEIRISSIARYFPPAPNAAASGDKPSVESLPRATGANALAVFGNEHYKIMFERETCRIAGMANLKTNAQLTPPGQAFNWLRLKIGRPGSLSYTFNQDEFTILRKKFSPRRVEFVFGALQNKVRVRIVGKADSTPLSRWSLQVKNESDYRVMGVTFPLIRSARIGADAHDDACVLPRHSGKIIKNPAGGKSSFHCSYCGSASMCWMDLYDSSGGLYIGGHNRRVRVTELVCKPDAGNSGVDLFMRRYEVWKPGERKKPLEFALGIHVGDWHWGADQYREFFWREFGKTRVPQWMRRAVGYSAERDPAILRWLGITHSQVWGSAGGSACPTWYLPHDRGIGGPNLQWSAKRFVQYQREFAAINRRVRKDAGHIGYYVHGESISPYYCYSDKIYNQPRKDFPRDLLPPDGDWFRRNRLQMYPTEKYVPNDKWKQLWNPARRKFGESYPVMSCAGKEWHAYLRKWVVDKYVKEYGCDVMYFDTIGARDAFVDYNPHCNLYGEGVWSERIMQMLSNIRQEARKKEKDFGMLIEGCGDYYGLIVGGMISNFDRQMQVFRYTLPDQIVYSGLSNGNWKNPDPALRRAFVNGAKYDMLKTGWTYRRFSCLRRAVAGFVDYPQARFMDDIGLAISSDKVKARVFVADTRDVSARMVCVDNNDLIADAVVRLRISGKFSPKRAFAFLWGGEVRKLDFTVENNAVVARVPRVKLCGLLFVDHVRDRRMLQVMLEENPDPQHDGLLLTLVNISGVPQKGGWRLRPGKTSYSQTEGDFTLAPGEIKVLPLNFTSANIEPRTHYVEVSFAGNRLIRWIGTMPLVRDPGFETTGVLVENVPEGKHCNVCRGNGKFNFSRILLYLKPGGRYRMSIMVKREGTFKSAYIAIHNALIKYNKYKPLKVFAAAKKAHDWKRFETVFKVPASASRVVAYCYFIGAQGKQYMDKVEITPLWD